MPRPRFFDDLRRFRDSRRPLVLIGFLAALVAQLEALALVLLVPWASTIAADKETYQGRLGPFSLSVGVWPLAVIIIGLVVSALALSILQLWLRARTVARWQKSARADLLQHWLATSWERQSADRVGALATVMEFVQRGGMVLQRVSELIRSSLTLLIFLVTAVLISPLVAGLLTVAGIVLSRALRPVVGLSRSSSQRLTGLTRRYNDELTEVAALGRDIKVFDANAAFATRLGAMSDEIEHARTRQALIGGLTQPLYQYVGLLLSVIAIAFIAKNGSNSVESIGSTALLLLRGLTYALGAQTAYQTIAETSPFLDSAEEFADSLVQAADEAGGAPVGEIDEVRLCNVSYRFADGDDVALAGVDIAFRRGEATGIVGVSGSGKTTLAQLMLRLRQPTSGTILMNGTPAGEFSLTSWRRRVGFVPQDVRLLHTSVLDNIRFLDRSIPRSAVHAALVAVGLAAEIESLPLGLDTQIGSAVRNLSGGQIQRIGIARALVRDPAVLVLDEPTSALDAHSEAIVHQTVETLRERMIVVIIAHRLSTLEHCDQLVVMRDGIVAMHGPADVVRSTSPYFRDVVSPTLQAE